MSEDRRHRRWGGDELRPGESEDRQDKDRCAFRIDVCSDGAVVHICSDPTGQEGMQGRVALSDLVECVVGDVKGPASLMTASSRPAWFPKYWTTMPRLYPAASLTCARVIAREPFCAIRPPPCPMAEPFRRSLSR